jgi:hypothetical protein
VTISFDFGRTDKWIVSERLAGDYSTANLTALVVRPQKALMFRQPCEFDSSAPSACGYCDPNWHSWNNAVIEWSSVLVISPLLLTCLPLSCLKTPLYPRPQARLDTRGVIATCPPQARNPLALTYLDLLPFPASKEELLSLPLPRVLAHAA